MRPLFLFLLLSLSSLVFPQENPYSSHNSFSIHPRINLQANVLQTVHLQNEYGKTDHFLGNSFSAGLEVASCFNENFYYGIGAAYQFKGSIDTTLGDLGLLPLYVFIDYPLIERNSFPIYLTVQFGYGLLILDNGLKSVNSGIFHALGLTTSVSKNVELKFLYAHNYGKVKLDNDEFRLRKENLSIAFYYKF
ncbi:MAG: hypothetical protein ACK4UV_01535 [Ignavibacterium sp.]